jgi:hypothetical protein
MKLCKKCQIEKSIEQEATLAKAEISQTSVKGLDGVSTKNNFVFGVIAPCQALTSVSDTKVTSKPQRFKILLKS